MRSTPRIGMLPDEVSTRIFAMSSAKKRILLVDDDEDLLEALVRSHRKHYDLVPACGAEEGLRKLEEEGPFCVIVSDYHMPVMNGLDFVSKFREWEREHRPNTRQTVYVTTRSPYSSVSPHPLLALPLSFSL